MTIAKVKISSKGRIMLPAVFRRRLGMSPGTMIEIIEEQDGLRLRVVRSLPETDLHKLAGMVTAPSQGAPRRLLDFDPASLFTLGQFLRSGYRR
jgi:antitoxin PrlF